MTDVRNQLIREITLAQQQFEHEQQLSSLEYQHNNENRISTNIHNIGSNNNINDNNNVLSTNNGDEVSSSNHMLNSITSAINAITGSNNSLNALNSSDININYTNIDRILEETFRNSNMIHRIISSTNVNSSNNSLNSSNSVSNSTELLNFILRSINNEFNIESNNNINGSNSRVNLSNGSLGSTSNRNSINDIRSNLPERTLYGSVGNLQYRSMNNNDGSNLSINNTPPVVLNHENSEVSLASNDGLFDFSMIDSFLAQGIEQLLHNEISIPQFISEYEAYEILNISYGGGGRNNENRNAQRDSQINVQQVNQRRIHENSTLYVLDQRLRNNVNINDPDFYIESVQQIMSTPYDPNSQDSLYTNNLAGRGVNWDSNGELVRSYYSLGSSSSDSSGNSQVPLNNEVEVNISELPVSEESPSNNVERVDNNNDSSSDELNHNSQNISSMANFNSPSSLNTPSTRLPSNNELFTNRVIRSYRSQFENDFHRYYDENGNLREDPIEEDIREGTSHENPVIDYRGRPNFYYEDIDDSTSRRNRPDLSLDMELFSGNSSDIIATILGAESREVRQGLIFSLIRGALAMRWNHEHLMEQMERNNVYREREESQSIIHHDTGNNNEEESEDENDMNFDGNRTSTTIRYRINESAQR